MVIPGSQVRALVGAPRKRPCEGVVCVHTSCGRPSQMARCVHPASTSDAYRVLCRWTRKPRGGAARRTIAGGLIESPEAANTSFGLRERPEKIWAQQNLVIIAPAIGQCRRTDQARSTAAWPEARSAFAVERRVRPPAPPPSSGLNCSGGQHDGASVCVPVDVEGPACACYPHACRLGLARCVDVDRLGGDRRSDRASAA